MLFSIITGYVNLFHKVFHIFEKMTPFLPKYERFTQHDKEKNTA